MIEKRHPSGSKPLCISEKHWRFNVDVTLLTLQVRRVMIALTRGKKNSEMERMSLK